MATVTFHGSPVKTSGSLPKVGSKAPSFELTGADLGQVHCTDEKGLWTVLNIFPSIDTPVCALSVKRFNKEAAAKANTRVLCISADLPFAQGRFCGAEGIKNVKNLSTFRAPNFGRDYGVLIVDSPLAGLLARAVVVVDPQGIVRYTELVPEIAQEPNYDAALAAIKA